MVQGAIQRPRLFAERLPEMDAMEEGFVLYPYPRQIEASQEGQALQGVASQCVSLD